MRVADISKECIIASGKPTKGGYARKSYKNKVYYTHRLTWFHKYGKFPRLLIHHICQNKMCINIEHLIELTPRQHLNEHGLRGVAKINADAKICKRGHIFDGHDGKQRTCSICILDNQKRYRARNKDWLNLKNRIYKRQKRTELRMV